MGGERRPHHRVSLVKPLHTAMDAIRLGMLSCSLPWDKRKSLPRNSKGFEPVEGYFDRTTSTESSGKLHWALL